MGGPERDVRISLQTLHVLEAFVEETAPARSGKVIEDHFYIEKIEPGKLWLMPLMEGKTIGPIPVPGQVTQLCKEGWDIGGVVAKVGKGWRLIEVWNVSP